MSWLVGLAPDVGAGRVQKQKGLMLLASTLFA